MAPNSEPLTSEAEARTARLETLEILLVEHNAGDARLVEELFKQSPGGRFEFRLAATLAEARELLYEHRPDCLLLDLSLPDAEQLDALVGLRQAAPDAAIVIVSGLRDERLAVRAVQQGAQDYLIKGRIDTNSLHRSISYAIARKRTENELAHRAMHDALTGLPTRTLFFDRLDRALARAQRHDALVGLMFIDLDDFKQVNDTFGHEAGDEVIAATGARLAGALRTNDTAARFGGDEFIVLCEDVADEQSVMIVAERLLDSIGEPIELRGEQIEINASMGVVLTNGDNDAGQMVQDADLAMYEAKQRNSSLELFDTVMRARIRRRYQLETELRAAVEQDEFVVAYQPQIDLASGEQVGLEALARWQHPTRGLLEPAAFIPQAEEIGLMPRIGDLILEQACSEVARWSSMPHSSAFVLTVNLCMSELADPTLCERIEAVLERTGLPPGRLRLETSEAIVMRDLGLARAVFRTLATVGVKLSIDDFGVGGSSLDCLRHLPVDALKLDRSFLDDISGEGAGRTIAAAIIALARTLGIATIAAGVEHAHQVSALRNLGCDVAQGFYLSRPGDARAAAESVGAVEPMIRLRAVN